ESSVVGCRLCALDHTRDALADANAHGRQTIAPAGTAQPVHQGRHDTSAAAAERMSERDRTARGVDDLRVELELANRRESLTRESLVELGHRALIGTKPGALQRISARRYRADTHDAGVHPRVAPTDNTRHRLEVEALGPLLAHQQQGARA